MTDPDMTEQVLRDFELLLMTKHRFALADVVVCMQRTVQDLHEVERSLTVAAASVLSYPDSDKICADTLGRISGQLEHLVGIAPTFLGEQEVAEFINALRDFERLSEGLETDMMPDIMKLHRAMTSISGDMTLLSEAVARSKSVCGLMTEKRDYLMRFLEEAVQVLENSNSRRVVQYGNTVEQLTAEFKLALEDEHLQSAKQLRFGIQAIETSMSTMLLPHFEICRTITTANAQVYSTTSSFTKAECNEIDAFVQTAAKLKSGEGAFRSVLQDTPGFLARLKLFEQAASKDAFLVCSSALKLQFRETLDQELFLAYVDDWNAKRNALQLIERSNEYRAATNHLQELKSAIGRAHELAQSSKEKLALDDPNRTALLQEVAQIFNEEGGTFIRMDALC